MTSDRKSQQTATGSHERGICEQSELELAERMEFLTYTPDKIVEIGCRTGVLSQLLQSRFPDTDHIGIDSPSDSDLQALGGHSADLIISNLSASFFDLSPFLVECHRVLKTEGVLLFSMFGPRSFEELRMTCEPDGTIEIYRAFPEMHDLGDLLLATGFINPVVDVDHCETAFTDLPGLVDYLDRSGIYPLLVRNAESSSTKSVQSKLVQQFNDMQIKGEFSLSVEFIYGIAWKGRLDSGTTEVSFHPMQ